MRNSHAEDNHFHSTHYFYLTAFQVACFLTNCFCLNQRPSLLIVRKFNLLMSATPSITTSSRKQYKFNGCSPHIQQSCRLLFFRNFLFNFILSYIYYQCPKKNYVFSSSIFCLCGINSNKLKTFACLDN